MKVTICPPGYAKGYADGLIAELECLSPLGADKSRTPQDYITYWINNTKAKAKTKKLIKAYKKSHRNVRNSSPVFDNCHE